MENKVVNEAVGAARDLDKDVRSKLFEGVDKTLFVEIDQTYPEIIQDGENMTSKEDAAAMHLAYVDRISKQILTHSLFLGLGFEVPTNHALSEAGVDKHLAAVGEAVTLKESPVEDELFYEYSVEHPGSTYTFLDSDRWLGGLRALHFFATRNDPDLVEFINRKLAQSSGLDDDWYKEVMGVK